MAHKVFICHSSKDKTIADAACAMLESQRIPCWIAPRDVLAGVEYGKAIIDALSDCQIVLLIFSKKANESPQVRREVERAVSKAKIIVPFRIEDVLPSDAMEYALSNTHWLDAMTPPLERHLEELCNAILRLLDQQPADPPAILQRPVSPSKPISRARRVSSIAASGAALLLILAIGSYAVHRCRASYVVSPVTIPAKPLSEDQILELLSVHSRNVVSLIRVNGVNFELTPALERKFVAAGADQSVLEAIRPSTPKLSVQNNRQINARATAEFGAPPDTKPSGDSIREHGGPIPQNRSPSPPPKPSQPSPTERLAALRKTEQQ
jgi:hypothetical protein